MKKLIITSGFMNVPIDAVRGIKNSSSGKLGSVFADIASLYFTDKIDDIVYIHSEGSMIPTCPVKKITIQTHEDVLNALKQEIDDNSIVIHAMAVSDFSVGGHVSKIQMSENIYNQMQNINNAADVLKIINDSMEVSDKLSSKEDRLLSLNRSIKIIDEIKNINQNVKLVGFKLLSNVTTRELLDVGENIKTRTNSDIVVANIKEDITSSNHVGYIISDKNLVRCVTKEEIAQEVLKNILNEN